ncbi:precorrin-8X methylmutase [Paenibacillus jilunlii]|uniref:Precorrin-8X methylmutase n=1 Tax=Paenibacillus jilunlii TaxID=682956 RepID=A0A1G9Q3H7_9BACL|nr:precorrin-8X methylmutase [Paenibacillus jilunlii]KWX73203.1 precorrin-8X methylmutase [Paenibacillus jilunlii]SDM05047.1 precorrin-8X methylmutase [Paenibacillus jilunlii]
MEFGTDFKPLTVQPQEIESLSFQMITRELGEHEFSALQYPVVQRIIHASADFELGRSLVFHPRAMEAGISAILEGQPIIADVRMVEAGIAKERIHKYGGEVRVHISDPDVIEAAKAQGTTRAILATRKACAEAPGGIYVIGNAPTALLELIRLIKEGAAQPGLIIGMPVGFVSAAESKDELRKLDIPYITNIGRKGGSTVVVAAVNALSLLAARQAGESQNQGG